MNPSQPSPPTPNPDKGPKAKLASLNGPEKLLALVGVVMVSLLLALAIYQVVEEPASPPTPATPVSQATAEVSLTAAGLTPATISIEAGTQLAWKNDDQAPHQVAADPHPLNDSIPGFDNGQLLQPGDSFSFTFETPGTYTIHDHLNPLDPKWQGTVVVE